MKIIIPVAVTCVVGMKKDGTPITQTIGFADFVGMCLAQYAPLGRGPTGAEMMDRLCGAFEKLNGDAHMELSENDFPVLKQAISSAQFDPAMNRRFLSFYRAVFGTGEADKKQD